MERIYHTWDEWECYPAGFYENRPPDAAMSDDEAYDAYAAFLGDLDEFKAGLERVLADWPNSCEHYLTNERMNRIAWLGQAAACARLGLPAKYKGGYNRLPVEQQAAADALALTYLNKWLALRGFPELSDSEAKSKTQANLY